MINKFSIRVLVAALFLIATLVAVMSALDFNKKIEENDTEKLPVTENMEQMMDFSEFR